MEDIDDVLSISLEYVEVIIENAGGVDVSMDTRQKVFPIVHRFFIEDNALSLTNKKMILGASIKSAGSKSVDILNSFDDFFKENSEEILKQFNDNIKEVSIKSLRNEDLPDIRKSIATAISSIKSKVPFEKVLLQRNTMTGDADKINTQSSKDVAKYFLNVVYNEYTVEKAKDIIQQAIKYKNTVLLSTINEVTIYEDAVNTTTVAPIAIKSMQRKP